MNELKPEDVMKALECSGYAVIGALLDVKIGKHQLITTSDVASLLKKYQAENAEKDAEIERLKKHQESVATVCNRANEHYNTLYEQAKETLKAEARAEAITEFAERVKKWFCADAFYNNNYVLSVVRNIASEMKEASENG